MNDKLERIWMEGRKGLLPNWGTVLEFEENYEKTQDS
jgi:hypothetical protein